ncbi:MAG: dihydroorotate dehydrogenase [Candidatus Omnitrophota bacterium]
MAVKLGVTIGKIRLKNPVLVASGTFGYGKEFETFFDLKKLGGIVTKTITLKSRPGNPPPRIVETPAGMLNAIGLANPGVEAFIKDKLPPLARFKVPVIVSIMGYSVDELVRLSGRLEGASGFDGIELNLSCPNVAYHGPARVFAHDAGLIAQAVKAVRKKTRRTLIAKLSPDVSDIGAMAKAAEDNGADAVSLVNTFMGMKIDLKSRRPFLANKTGGLSGPCIRPIAVRMVWQARQRVRIPIIGIGGISASGSSVDAALLSNAGISGATSGQTGFAQGTAANATAQADQSPDAAKAAETGTGDDPEEQNKKKKGITLAAKVSRVTVLLPTKNN